jgi:chloramphenicol 3-O-phosphotransferase
MSEPPSRVIFLNGTSSSGKTTLARAIQDESDIPFVYWGIDTLFGSVPPNWGGGRDGPLSRDGFWYDRTGRDAGGHPIVVIRYGQVGRRMLHSSCAAAAAFAHGGDHLVIDESRVSKFVAKSHPKWRVVTNRHNSETNRHKDETARAGRVVAAVAAPPKSRSMTYQQH